MNTAGHINGVSKLHSVVSRKMWSSGFRNIPFNEIPIDYITNGVHIRSHLSREMEELFYQYLGEKWIEDLSSEEIWERVDKIPDQELWRTHERRRERLVAFARRSLISQIKARRGSMREMQQAAEALDPTVLTIGFARRFATYKRATLIFKQLDRLVKMFDDADRPIQMIIAGKAHPKDDEGKRLIQEVFQIANEERFRKRLVFIENYDMNVARYLVEGCDIWLNNPRRPLEASGTSGMKVIANGGLNFSILDGWWDEAFAPELGFKIGNGEDYDDSDEQDEIESNELLKILEHEIIPLFYDRGPDKLPRRWISMVKNSIRQLAPVFNTHRMVKQYFEKFYYPSYQRRKDLLENELARVRGLAAWRQHVIHNWDKIRLVDTKTTNKSSEVQFGEKFILEAQIHLGALTPDDVEVQIYHGPVDKQNEPDTFSISVMKLAKHNNGADGTHRFSGAIVAKENGLLGYTIRVLPKHDLMIHPYELGTVFWA
jgi:starch phosphorylase